jgi:hypothetical protein
VIGRDQSGRRRRGQCESSNTFQQIGLRLRWSSRTSSRTSVGSLSRCDSRSPDACRLSLTGGRRGADALIAFAAAPRSWAATCAAASAAKAARRASPMPTSPLTTRDRHRWRRGRVSRTPIRLPRTVTAACRPGTYLQKGRLRAVDSRVRLPAVRLTRSWCCHVDLFGYKGV